MMGWRDRVSRLGLCTERTACLVLSVLGIALSCASLLGLCMGGCTSLSGYRLAGLHFGVIGIGFFAVAALLSYAKWDRTLFLSMTGAMGAELLFIALQKGAGTWCAICLAVAAVVFLLFILSLRRVLVQWFVAGSGGVRFLAGTCAAVVIAMLGFTVSAMVLDTPMAQTVRTAQKVFSPTPSGSDIEVRVFVGWRCPVCRAMRSEIESAERALKGRASFSHIAVPLTANDYDLIALEYELIKNNPQKADAVRNILWETADLSDKERRGHAAAQGLVVGGVTMSEVIAAIASRQDLAQAHGVTKVPTVVVASRGDTVGVRIEGKDATVDNILRAVFMVQEQAR